MLRYDAVAMSISDCAATDVARDNKIACLTTIIIFGFVQNYGLCFNSVLK